MKTSRKATRLARRLFRSCLVDGTVDEMRVRKIAQQVLRFNRRGSIALLSALFRLVRLDRSRHVAEVDSADILPEDLRSNVAASLARLYGSDIRISFARRRALIGGMRIKVGDDVYDGSVRAGLASLERRFEQATGKQ